MSPALPLCTLAMWLKSMKKWTFCLYHGSHSCQWQERGGIFNRRWAMVELFRQLVQYISRKIREGSTAQPTTLGTSNGTCARCFTWSSTWWFSWWAVFSIQVLTGTSSWSGWSARVSYPRSSWMATRSFNWKLRSIIFISRIIKLQPGLWLA